MERDVRRTLGDVLEVSRGISWEAHDERDQPRSGVYPVLRIPNVQDQLVLEGLLHIRVRSPAMAAACMANPGTILLVGSNGNPERVGNAVYVERGGHLFASFLMGARVRAGADTDPKFLFHYVASPRVQDMLTRSVQGTTGLKNLSEKTVTGMLLPDLPIAEQRRTVEVLDTLDDAIRGTEQLVKKLERMKRGLLHDLLTRGIDDNGELRDPNRHPKQFKGSPLGRLPRSWDVVVVRDAGSVRLGRQRAPHLERGPHLHPYLRVANVYDGWINYSDILCMNFTPEERTAYSVEPGDIFLNEGQSLELVGRSAVYDGPPGVYCFQNSLVRFRCHPTRCVPGYAQAVFKNWLDTRQFTRVARQTTSMAHLGADRFASMMFPVPPLREQEAIARRLDVLRNRGTNEALLQTKLRLLKRGLSDDLLTGRVRVAGAEQVNA